MALAPFMNITELCWVGRMHLEETVALFFQRGMNTNGITKSISGGISALSNSKHYWLSVVIDFIMCDKWCLVKVEFEVTFFPHPFSPGHMPFQGRVQNPSRYSKQRENSQKSFPLIHNVYLGIAKLRLTFLSTHKPDVPTSVRVERLICGPVGSTTRAPNFSSVDAENIK